jgi:hypothetical protein
MLMCKQSAGAMAPWAAIAAHTNTNLRCALMQSTPPVSFAHVRLNLSLDLSVSNGRVRQLPRPWQSC